MYNIETTSVLQTEYIWTKQMEDVHRVWTNIFWFWILLMYCWIPLIMLTTVCHINRDFLFGDMSHLILIHISLHWRHNDHDGVSNHQPRDCLLNRLFRRRSKKTSKLRVTGLCVGNSPGPVNSPHKGPVTRKMFPFDDVIMIMNEMASTLANTFKLKTKS